MWLVERVLYFYYGTSTLRHYYTTTLLTFKIRPISVSCLISSAARAYLLLHSPPAAFYPLTLHLPFTLPYRYITYVLTVLILLYFTLLYPLTSYGTTLLHASSLSLVPNSYLPYLYQRTTTLSLHTVNTRTSKRRTFEQSPFHHTNHYHYTQITQYPIFPRPIDCLLGTSSLIYHSHRSGAPLQLLHHSTHLQRPAPVSLQPHDKPSPDTPFAFCLELSCSGPVERF